MKNIILVLLFIPCGGYAQQWRLTEEVYQEYKLASSVYVTLDSTRYIYGRNNDLGGLPDGNPINYDTKKYYNLQPSVLALRLQHEQLFMPDKKIEVDTRFVAKTGGMLELYTADSFYYSNNRLDEQVFCGKAPEWGALKKTMYRYDTAGNLEIVWTLGRSVVGEGYILGDRKCYSYDSLNRLIRDSVVGYNGSFYSKETNGYIYDSAGWLVRKVQLRPNNSADTIRSTFYLFDTQGQLLADSTVNTYNPTPYVEYTHSYTYYPDGKLKSDTTWDYPLGPTFRIFAQEKEYYYNQQGLLIEVAIRKYRNGNISSAKRILYNYEIYWPNSVEKIQPLNNTISVFPVPSSGLLNITAQFADAEEVRVMITDIQGRVQRSWTDKGDKQYNKQVSVHGFAPGNYFISFDTGKGRAVRQFVVR